MMGTPSAALSLRPTEFPDPLDAANKYQRYQMGQQELQSATLTNQQRAQDLKEQQVINGTLASTRGDLRAALPLLAGKVSAKTYLGLQKHDADVRKSLAESNDSDFKIQKDLNDRTSQLVHDALAMPDDQYMAQWPKIAAAAKQLHPDLQIDLSQPLPKDQLQAIGLGLLTTEQYNKQEAERRAAAHDLAMENKPPAAVEEFESFYKDYIGATGKPNTPKTRLEARAAFKEQSHAPTDVNQYISDYLATNNLPNTPENRMKGHRAFTKETKIDPGVARAEIFVNQRPTEVADPNAAGQTVILPAKETIGMAGKSSSSVVTPKAMDKYMTSGAGGKTLTAFNTAISHLDQLGELAGALDNGDLQIVNKIGQSYAKATGAAAPVNFDAAKAAVSGEIAAAFKSSGATDQEISGITQTFQNYQSPAQLAGAIKTYRQLLNSKRDQLKAQNDAGRGGKPNFGEQSQFSHTATGPNGQKIGWDGAKWVPIQ